MLDEMGINVGVQPESNYSYEEIMFSYKRHHGNMLKITNIHE